MHPLHNGSQAEQRPANKPRTGLAGWFTESGENNVPSYPGADWFNHVIAEFQNALSAAGVVFDSESDKNLANAFNNLALSYERVLGENARIWPLFRDLEVGDFIPSSDANGGLPITHVNANGNIHEIYPFASGEVLAITDSGLNVGGVAVKFKADPVKTFKAGDYGLTVGSNVDNTEQALAMLSGAQAHDGYFEIDLQGGFFRVYGGGNLSPLKLVGKEFTIRNGGFYAANASVSPVSVGFPSTITFDKCTYTAENFTCFAKGEKWGNTDASSSLDYDGRASWIAENGGHAIAVVRSKYNHINVAGALAGSVAAIYFASSRGAALGGNAYCASLGCSAYNADTWCGPPDDVGIGDFIHITSGTSAVATEHKRPEDGNVIGSAEYCGKMGFLGEGATGEDVKAYINGGRWVGFYANGSSMDLGNAFGATSAAVVAFNPTVGDAASIIRVDNSSPVKSVCKVYNCSGTKIGLTGVMVSSKSFGECDAFLSGSVDITSDKTWPGSGVAELVNSSVVANRAVNIAVNVELSASVTGNATRLSHNSRACYGGIKVAGGDYSLAQYICYSKGWGGAGAKTRSGFVAKSNPVFRILSAAAVDEIIHWQDVDDFSTATYVYIDIADSTIISEAFRRVDFVQQTSASRRELLSFPRTLDNCYAIEADKPRETVTVKAISSGGFAGENWLYTLEFANNKPILFPCAICGNSSIRLIPSASGAVEVVGNKIRQTVLIAGAVDSDFLTVGNEYAVLGG
ncbi:hypothetical protein [Shewanella sp. 1180_01]|uniref:hypothetical protein n=1 Tax=Shewanella sp. 1180_01 TaxID=2604451 RepID=UPI004064B4A4